MAMVDIQESNNVSIHFLLSDGYNGTFKDRVKRLAESQWWCSIQLRDLRKFNRQQLTAISFVWQEVVIWQMMLFFGYTKEGCQNRNKTATKEERVCRKGAWSWEEGKRNFSANKIIANLQTILQNRECRRLIIKSRDSAGWKRMQWWKSRRKYYNIRKIHQFSQNGVQMMKKIVQTHDTALIGIRRMLRDRKIWERSWKIGWKRAGRALNFHFGDAQIGRWKVTVKACWTIHPGQDRKEQHWRHWWYNYFVQ